jgi:aspartyl-tRNA(Asn)/glutamyl-tRNA(Gln) amidotransferase subunit B
VFIGGAVEWEARRQIEILENDGVIEQETRLFDPDSGQTRSMRSKEEAHDYRYFPDPDLLPLVLTQELVDEVKASLPEHPDARRRRYEKELGLSVYNAGVLLNETDRTEEFEKWRELAPDVSATALVNWLINEHIGRLHKERLTFKESPIPPAVNAALVELREKNTITGPIAKTLYDQIWEANTASPPREYVSNGAAVRTLVTKLGLEQVNDTGAIEKIVDDIIAKNVDKVADAKANPKAIGWFVGQIMKASGGKANPKVVNDLLKSKLDL